MFIIKRVFFMPQKHFRKIHISGFTLVELIVVITILVILGTIGFVSLQGYAGSARDSVRIENLSNLHKWLSLFQIVSGVYPMPENPVNITASGTIIGYQGFAKDMVGGIAKLSAWATKDPLDASMFTTYSVNGDRTKMQLIAFLEDGSNVTAFIPSVYASANSDYSKRIPTLKGDTLGILLASGSLQPAQESGTGVDIVLTNSGYIMQFGNTNKISGTGMALKAGIIKDWLVLYWPFDECSWTGIRDISWNWQDGIIAFPSYITFQTNSNGCNISLSWNTSTTTWTITSINAVKNFSQITVSFKLNKNLAGTNDWEDVFYHPALWYHFMANGDIMTRSWLERIAWRTPYEFFVEDSKFNIAGYLDGNWHNHTTTIWNWYYKYYIDWKLIYQSNLINNNPVSVWWLQLWLQNMNWKLDEIRIYNRALSDSEIQTLYNATK